MPTFTESFTIALVFLGILAVAGFVGCILSIIADWKKIKFVKPWHGPDIPRQRPLTRHKTMKLEDARSTGFPMTPIPQLSPRPNPTPRKGPDKNNLSPKQNGVVNKNSINKQSTVAKNKTTPSNTNSTVSNSNGVTSNVKRNSTVTSKKLPPTQQRSNLPIPDVNKTRIEEQELKKIWEKAQKQLRQRELMRSNTSLKRGVPKHPTALRTRKASTRKSSIQDPPSANKYKNLLSPMTLSNPTSRESLLSSACASGSTITLRHVDGHFHASPSKRIISLLKRQKRIHRTMSKESLLSSACKSTASLEHNAKDSSQLQPTPDVLRCPSSLPTAVSKESLITLDNKSMCLKDGTSSPSSETDEKLLINNTSTCTPSVSLIRPRSSNVCKQGRIRDGIKRRYIARKNKALAGEEGIRFAYRILRF